MEIFVNPFACNRVSPLKWREIQELIKLNDKNDDPYQVLSRNNISVRESAVHYLTPLQIREVEAELEKMEYTLDFESSRWWLENCLNRAYRVNSML